MNTFVYTFNSYMSFALFVITMAIKQRLLLTLLNVPIEWMSYLKKMVIKQIKHFKQDKTSSICTSMVVSGLYIHAIKQFYAKFSRFSYNWFWPHNMV